MKKTFVLVFTVVALAQAQSPPAGWIAKLAAQKRTQAAVRTWRSEVTHALKQRKVHRVGSDAVKRQQGAIRSGHGSDTIGMLKNLNEPPEIGEPEHIVMFQGREIRPQTISKLLVAGDLRAALLASEALYRAYPDKVDVALVRCRVLVAAGRWGQAFDSIVPFAGRNAMVEANLYTCLASAHLGNVLSGEQEYCEDSLRRYAPRVATEYLKTVQHSSASAELLAWIALGASYNGHADGLDALSFWDGALALDPGNPLVADLLVGVEWHDSPLKWANLVRPVLAAALPRAKGEMRNDIGNALQRCEAIIDQAGKPTGG